MSWFYDKKIQLGKENDYLKSSFKYHNEKNAKLSKHNQELEQEERCLKEAEEERAQSVEMCGQLREEGIHHNDMVLHEQINARNDWVIGLVQEPTQYSGKEDATCVEQESGREVKDTDHEIPPKQLGEMRIIRLMGITFKEKIMVLL